MNNKEIYNEFKKQVAVYKFEQEYKENKRISFFFFSKKENFVMLRSVIL